ncbi:HyaD/HybD family hydrogenase maturation endopeptidase [Chloroflexota bacterium]
MTIDKTEERGRKNPAPSPCILILGVGNILLSDEGVGIRVVEAMKGMTLPDHVELMDGGTGAFDLFNIIADRDNVIIIDAVKGGGEPGAVYRFRPDDISVQGQYLTSVHQVSLMDTLTMAKLTGCSPRDIVIYGIEPKKLGWGLELSPEVAAVIPRVIELVLNEL